MAKAILSNLITSINGSIGNHTYTTHRGVVRVKKKITKSHNPRTPLQMKNRETWKESISKWQQMPLKNRALWEFYARYITSSKINIGNLMKKGTKHPLSGMNAYIAINQLLTSSELHRTEKPPSSSIFPPPTPATDIIQSGTYHKEFKFKVWLPRHYNEKCVARISLKVREHGSYVFTLSPIVLSTKPTLIEIKKVKVVRKSQNNKLRVAEIDLKEINHPIIQIQMMTVAQNGRFSLHSPIYIIEVFNP